jgi:hypothetical protein
MANRNSDRRGQYIDRIHLFNKRMFAEGITGPNSSGYHPQPAKPTCSDLFDSVGIALNSIWELNSDGWVKKNGELLHTKNENAQALIKSQPAVNYLFEVNLRLSGSTAGSAGIVAYWKDKNNWLKIGINAKAKKWIYRINENGKVFEKTHSLAGDFNFQAYHKITIYKNSYRFNIDIDEHPAPGESTLATKFIEQGRSGIFSGHALAAFDGALYTIGWDEFDSTITGWTAVDKSRWQVNADGIHSSSDKETAVLKGDLLSDYEFSTQLSADSFSGEAGIYAAYQDQDNFLKLLFNFSGQQMTIAGKLKGKEIPAQSVNLENRQEYYPDMKYTDLFEKFFSLNDEVILDEFFLNKIPQGNPDTIIEDIHLKMNIYYRENNVWKELKEFDVKPGRHPGIVNLSFKPVKADAIKFVNKQPDDQRFYLSRLGINERFRNSYNCRVVNRNGKQIYIVNGKEVFRSDYKIGNAKVGLINRSGKFSFNGITCYHIPD